MVLCVFLKVFPLYAMFLIISLIPSVPTPNALYEVSSGVGSYQQTPNEVQQPAAVTSPAMAVGMGQQNTQTFQPGLAAQAQMPNNSLSGGDNSAPTLMSGLRTPLQMPYPRAHLNQGPATTTAAAQLTSSSVALIEVRPAANEPVGSAVRSKRQAGIPPECCTADPCDPCATTPCIACPVC